MANTQADLLSPCFDAMLTLLHLPGTLRDRTQGEKSWVLLSFRSPPIPESFPWELVSEETLELLWCFGLGTVIQGSLPASCVRSSGRTSVLSCWCVTVQRMSEGKPAKIALKVADYLFTTGGHCRKHTLKKHPKTTPPKFFPIL